MSGEPPSPARLNLLWGRRSRWQILARWYVALGIIIAALAARAAGFEFRIVPVLGIGVAVLAYNLVLWLAERRFAEPTDRRLAFLGVLADYAALLLLFQYTGGAWSPLLPFLVFHVIIAAIQFRPRFSLQVAAVGASGVWLLFVAQLAGWWPAEELSFRGTSAHVAERPELLAAMLTCFTATLFLSAVIAGRIMHLFRERVTELVEERTRFMLLTAHNLRAPLGAGLSMLDLVKGGDVGPVNERQATMLGKVDTRLRSLHATIGELLTIAKTRDWSREITDVVVDLRELARRTEQTFADEAVRGGVRLEFELDDGLPAIDSGADLLDQLMENLVSNAIKYTPSGGRVAVRFTQVVPDEVRIVVEDDGIGIPEDDQERLFEEFFRASNAKRTAVGSGLGLVLVRQTVERHRGRISVSSAVDRGTTITVDLPVRLPTTKAPA